MFHKNKMGSIIRSTGTVFYSPLYVNSLEGFKGLKCTYSVISVIVDSLCGNTKNRESTCSWTARGPSILGRVCSKVSCGHGLLEAFSGPCLKLTCWAPWRWAIVSSSYRQEIAQISSFQCLWRYCTYYSYSWYMHIVYQVRTDRELPRSLCISAYHDTVRITHIVDICI